MAICPQCGADIQDGQQPCRRCGAAPMSAATAVDRSAATESPQLALPRGPGSTPIQRRRDLEQPTDLSGLRAAAKVSAPEPEPGPDTQADRPSPWLDRLIGLVLLIAIAIPVALGLDPPAGPPAPSATRFFAALDRLPAGSVIVVAFDWDPGSLGEMEPISTEVVQHALARHLRLVTMGLTPAGPGLADQIIGRLTTAGQYGTAVVNLGYVSGDAAALAGLATNVQSMAPRDELFGRPVADFPIMANFHRLSDARMIVLLASDDLAPLLWIQQIQSRYAVPMVAAVSAGAAPALIPYTEGRNPALLGLIAGLPDLWSAASDQTALVPGTIGGLVAGESVLTVLLVVGVLLGLGRTLSTWHRRRLVRRRVKERAEEIER